MLPREVSCLDKRIPISVCLEFVSQKVQRFLIKTSSALDSAHKVRNRPREEQLPSSEVTLK